LRNFVWVNEFLIKTLNDDGIHSIINGIPIINNDKVLSVLIPLVIQWTLYFLTFIVLWINSEKISRMIIGNDEVNEVQCFLNFENILSAGIILLCIYFIQGMFPRILFNLSDFLIPKKVNFEYGELNYKIEKIMDMICYLIVILISILGIKYNKMIVKYIMKKII
jgi:hypothetical protein